MIWVGNWVGICLFHSFFFLVNITDTIQQSLNTL
jgi:hypothetical protein